MPPSGPVIRPALPAEASRLAEIHVASWRAAYAGLLPEATLAALEPAARLPRWERRFQEAETLILVAEVRSTLHGFIFGGPTRDEGDDPARCAEFQALYLLPEAWGKGLGSALCDAFLGELASRGFTETTLWVLRGNARARVFYERKGFVLDGASRLKPQGPDLVLDLVRYRRVLG